jgi:hypothetical protein
VYTVKLTGVLVKVFLACHSSFVNFLLMRYFLLLSIALFFSIRAFTQDVEVSTVSPYAIKDYVLEVRERNTDIVIPIYFEIKDGDGTTALTIQDDPFTATSGADYSFDQSMPATLQLNKANKYLAELKLTIKKDPKDGKPNEKTSLIISWQDAKDKKMRFITLVIFIRDLDNKFYSDASNTNKLELVQFTDFLGFDNDRPNGLLQQEFRFKWALNRNMKKMGENGTHTQFFRSLVFPDILFNRIDKSKQEVDYSYKTFLPGTDPKDTNTRKLTTMDLFRYSNFQLAARLVLFALHTKNFRVHLQTGIRMLRNRPFYADTIKTGIDSGKVRSDFRSVYSFAPNIEIYSKVLNVKESGVYMDLILGMMSIRMKDSYYSQYDASVVDEFNRATNLVPVTSFPKRKPSPIWYASARLARDWGENFQNAIFFRINYYYQTGKFNRLVSQPPAPQPPVLIKDRLHNHYLQLQLGLTFGLDNLFKPKEEKKDEKKDEKKPGKTENNI